MKEKYTVEIKPSPMQLPEILVRIFGFLQFREIRKFVNARDLPYPIPDYKQLRQITLVSPVWCINALPLLWCYQYLKSENALKKWLDELKRPKKVFDYAIWVRHIHLYDCATEAVLEKIA